jgi:hypothetical protein
MADTKKIAVLAYGSLLAHPGDWFGQNMETLVRCKTPFGVEYLGCSQRRCGAPTLTRSKDSMPVYGGLIVVREKDAANQLIDLKEVRKRLAEREGTSNPNNIKDDIEYLGYRLVYSDFRAIFNSPTPAELSKAAVESVARCYKDGHVFMNGIRYLRENIEWGVITNLTRDYEATILRDAGAKTLDDAEQKLVEAA